MRENLGLSDHLQVLVLQAEVLMLYHHLPNRCLLGKVQLVDTLFEQLVIGIVQG